MALGSVPAVRANSRAAATAPIPTIVIWRVETFTGPKVRASPELHSTCGTLLPAPSSTQEQTDILTEALLRAVRAMRAAEARMEIPPRMTRIPGAEAVQTEVPAAAEAIPGTRI